MRNQWLKTENKTIDDDDEDDDDDNDEEEEKDCDDWMMKLNLISGLMRLVRPLAKIIMLIRRGKKTKQNK